jgi:hypothetical protein
LTLTAAGCTITAGCTLTAAGHTLTAASCTLTAGCTLTAAGHTLTAGCTHRFFCDVLADVVNLPVFPAQRTGCVGWSGGLSHCKAHGQLLELQTSPVPKFLGKGSDMMPSAKPMSHPTLIIQYYYSVRKRFTHGRQQVIGEQTER